MIIKSIVFFQILLQTKDGLFLEKMNAGRIDMGNWGHSIGKNVQTMNVKFTSKQTFD